MRRFVTISVIFCAGQLLGAQAPTPALTRVEQRLAELLEPRGKASSETPAPNPPPRKPVLALDRPELPLQSAAVLPPAPPKPEGKPVRPRTLPEDAPLVRNFSQPEAPPAVQMPVGPLVRLWSNDVNEPLPLPILGTGVRDRASLADPSLEASVAAAQAKLSPVRTQMVPFQPHNLPDPFEHSHAVRLRNPPEELAAPPLTVSVFGRK